MKKTPVAIAVAASASAAFVDVDNNTADAVTLDVKLRAISSASSGGCSIANISSSTATWSFDTTTGIVTASGLVSSKSQITPVLPGQLFTHNIIDLAVGGGGAAAATSYSCVEGNFGTSVFASLCGNYNYGADYMNESSTSWGPGTAYSRTGGGDDIALGIQQNISFYDGMTSHVTGTTLLVSNATGFSGVAMRFEIVPVPPAFLLFGSALGLLGWVRRKAA